MSPEKPEQIKKSGIAIFWDEFSRSNLTVIILAILTGIILGGVLVAATTTEVYAAFKVSLWGGLKLAFTTAWNTYVALFTGSVGNPEKIRLAFESGDPLMIRRAINPFFESLVQTTPYIFAGLAVALGFRVGLFNIGAEGQIFIGAITGVWAGYAIHGLPPIIHIPVALLFGALGGAIWGFVPGFLKAKTGAHEVITTIMMNYIAFRLSDWLLKGPMGDPTEYTPKTPWILESAQLPKLFDLPIRFHIGFFVALLMAVLVYLLLFKTTWGLELRMVGSNPNAARYAGIKITMSTVIAMVLSGALAGLAGANEVLGVNHRLIPAFSSGYGFDSIALALLGKSHPFGVILSALLFGFLRNGARSMQLTVGVPIDIVSILQAMILAFIAAPAIIRTIYRLREPKHAEDIVSLQSWKG
ncbi:MAG: simple sugar transport system permease protein [Chloroflexi bacterium]|nr:MAG: simple sugar transport system permease protein [Chloroflexota bacterium]MBA4375710.1 ABC transporter permease [Anaerolinea sp.]